MLGNVCVHRPLGGVANYLALVVDKLHTLEHTLCAQDSFADVGGGVRVLVAVARHAQTVAHVVVDCEVREPVAVLRAREVCAASAQACRDLYGHAVAAERPHQHVNIVDVLFDDVVARRPDEAPPVLDLVFEGFFRALRSPCPCSDVAAVVPVALSRNEVADFAVLHSLDELLILRRVATLVAANYAQTLLGGFFRELVHLQALLDIDRAGFFEERVFASRDDFRIVGSAEDGRSRLDYNVAGFCENAVYGVPADKLFDFVGIDDFAGFGFAARHLYGVFEDFLNRIVGLLFEEVAERDKLNVLVARNHIASRTRAASAATDEGNLDSVVALDLGKAEAGQSRRRAEYCTAFYEASSIHMYIFCCFC